MGKKTSLSFLQRGTKGGRSLIAPLLHTIPRRLPPPQRGRKNSASGLNIDGKHEAVGNREDEGGGR